MAEAEARTREAQRLTDHRDGRGPAAEDKDPAAAWPGQAAMASLPAPPLPGRACPPSSANRALVYLRPGQDPGRLAARGHHGTSGMILAGDGTAKALRILQGSGAAFPLLIDPEGYKDYTATREAPFRLPGADSLIPATLDSVLDAQLQAGATAALTPTGYIPAAATDVLKAAVGEFAELGPRPTRSSSRRWTSRCSAAATSSRRQRSWPTSAGLSRLSSAARATRWTIPRTSSRTCASWPPGYR